jgi:hypothetical protein
MALDKSRITSQAKATMIGHGADPDAVPFGGTGKGFLELLIDAVAEAVVDEVVANMEIRGVTVELPAGSHIIAVSGGSGAPAIGTPNPTPETHAQNNSGTGLVA